MAVVLVRSYSWICGSSSEEIETATPGSSSRDDLGDAALVRGLEEAEQERDRDRLDAGGAKLARDGPGLVPRRAGAGSRPSIRRARRSPAAATVG